MHHKRMLFVPLTLSEPEIVNIIISRASRYISHPGLETIHILRQQLGPDSRVVRAESECDELKTRSLLSI